MTRPSRPLNALLIGVLAGVALAAPVLADTVVLKKGKPLEDVVVSRNDDEWVVVNPFRSRHPDMTFGIEDEHRIPREKVESVVIADPPLVECRRRAAAVGLTADQHVELARWCEEHDLEDHATFEWERALAADPECAPALEHFGPTKLKTLLRGNPELHPELRELERKYVATDDPAELGRLWARMKELGTKRDLEYLERARRSRALHTPGRHDKVPVTLGAEASPGATFCLYVPSSYDVLPPTPLLIGLHGGGPGGRDRRVVTGSGESAMNFYQRLAEQWGMVVACPSAVVAGWPSPENEPLVDNLVRELQLTFNVDRHRIYLIGHSIGGFGTWHWGPHRAELWAACAPCAGGGGPNGIDKKGVPVYVFHGADDGIVGPASDRAAARHFADQRKPPDFVYTELNGVGHGFPDSVRTDIFEFFAGRRKDRGRKLAVRPASSFELKVERDEKKVYGDPSELPPVREDTADVGDLAERLEGGGGAAVAAAEELSALAGKPEAGEAADEVAKVLRSRKAQPDARALAADVLGALGLEDSLDDLARAADDDEHTVVGAVAHATGRIAGAHGTDAENRERAAEVLRTATRRLGRFFDDSFSGDRVSFTEYELRTQALAVALRAWVAVGAVDGGYETVEQEVARRVFLPKEPHVIPVDSRFVHIPPRARGHLAAALGDALVALGDPRGAELAAEVSERWSDESNVRNAMSIAIDALAK